MGQVQRFYLIYGNRGNIDAPGAYIWVTGIPRDADVSTEFEFEFLTAPAESGQPSLPVETETGRMIPLLILSIPAASTGTIPIDLTVHSTEALKLKTSVLAQ